MSLNPDQTATLKAYILSVPALAAKTSGPGTDYGAIRDALNLSAAPDFYVWRTAVSRAQVYNETSPDGTTWNWTTYKNQSVTEQNAWVQMFMGDSADFSRDNFRAGVDAIFSGAGAPALQRAHVQAVGKRKATVAEKALANTAGGNGAAATPAKVTWEGAVELSEIAGMFNA